MGMMDKILGAMNIGAGSDEYEDDEYAQEDDGFVETKKPEREPEPEETKVRTFERKPFHESAKKRAVQMNSNDVSVCVFKPQSFDEARTIAETLLDNKIVFLNFEGVDISVAQRVLDIVTGTCIAINGKLQKMSNSIFVAAPENVDVSGEYLASTMDI